MSEMLVLAHEVGYYTVSELQQIEWKIKKPNIENETARIGDIVECFDDGYITSIRMNGLGKADYILVKCLETVNKAIKDGHKDDNNKYLNFKRYNIDLSKFTDDIILNEYGVRVLTQEFKKLKIKDKKDDKEVEDPVTLETVKLKVIKNG